MLYKLYFSLNSHIRDIIHTIIMPLSTKKIIIPNCLIDLHLHLDGSISVNSARQLASLSNIPLPPSDDELTNLLACESDCRDLNEFLTKFELPLKLLQSPQSLLLCAKNLCNELKGLGLIYAEIRFAPQLHTQKGMSQETAIQSVLEGIKESGLMANVILCCMRGNDNKAQNEETLTLCAKYLSKGVCALDLAGAEALFPNPQFFDLFEKAKEYKLPITIHAGEALGHESVETAISMGARRIGHGVRSIESEKTLALLKENNIILECCPTSNLMTRVFNDYTSLPFNTFRSLDVRFTINSDDMAVCRTNVRQELELTAMAFDYDSDTIKEFLLCACDAAFISDCEKEKLKSIVKREFDVQ